MSLEKDLAPVFVIGAARSGTTLLADRIMSSMPGVGYTGEIDFVWRYGEPFKHHDVRVSGKRSHIQYIRNWFSRFRSSSSAEIIVDKTPSNVLRIPWIKSVFPDAKFIHIIRDGRAVSLSSRDEWAGLSSSSLDSREYRMFPAHKKILHLSRRKLRVGQRIRDIRSALVALGDIPKAVSAYGKIFGANIGRSTWGPRVPGLRDIAMELSVLDACAFQWDFCVRQGRMACGEMENSIEIRYERLLKRPFEEIERVAEFMGVSSCDSEVQDAVASIDATRSTMPRGSDEELEYLSRLLHPTLVDLGYSGGID